MNGKQFEGDSNTVKLSDIVRHRHLISELKPEALIPE